MRIVLDNTVKRFGANVVVDHISLSIEDGEFFTLLGPSGCGKTTLLRMVAGFHDPDGGDIRFGDRSVVHIPAHRRQTGMVFQNYALFPHMTVFENVAYGLRARDVGKDEIRKRVASILSSVQLGHLEARYPRQLSGGQQQRVALARALVIRPQALLMDEPLSNLDAKLRVTMREEIRKIQKDLGITTLYVTHDQEEAMAVSDRIAILYGGKMQQVGTPWDIYFSPKNRFTAEFMGACTLLEFRAVGYDAESGITAGTIDGKPFFVRAGRMPEDEPVTLMLRPDWIRPATGHVPENRFKGIVRESTFLGTAIVYQVEALGALMRVDVPDPRGHSVKQEGEPLELTFAPDRPVVVQQ